MEKINLKTPISYYGGKQSMLKVILPLIPSHSLYVEPFFGGGAVFWAKDKTQAEVINDYNGMVVNFYQQLKTNYKALKQKIDATPYSREVYKAAMFVYSHPYIHSDIHKAWAFWVCCIQGYANKIGSWRGSCLTHKEAALNFNKKEAFGAHLSERLQYTQIECVDAVALIKSKDTPETFFYIDPPYVDSNQGHYGGYTQQHFDGLLETLQSIKGKFLLSSYPNEHLSQHTALNGWHSKAVDKPLSASNVAGKRKIEMLTANYAI